MTGTDLLQEKLDLLDSIMPTVMQDVAWSRVPTLRWYTAMEQPPKDQPNKRMELFFQLSLHFATIARITQQQLEHTPLERLVHLVRTEIDMAVSGLVDLLTQFDAESSR